MLPAALLDFLSFLGLSRLSAPLTLGPGDESLGGSMAVPDRRHQPGRWVGDLARFRLNQPIELLDLCPDLLR